MSAPRGISDFCIAVIDDLSKATHGRRGLLESVVSSLQPTWAKHHTSCVLKSSPAHCRQAAEEELTSQGNSGATQKEDQGKTQLRASSLSNLQLNHIL